MQRIRVREVGGRDSITFEFNERMDTDIVMKYLPNGENIPHEILMDISDDDLRTIHEAMTAYLEKL